MLIQDRTIELDGVTLHYRETGDPAAPPLVLLHALGRDARDWDSVTAALADSHRVFALDQRGHGESGRPDHYSFEAMRDDLQGFLTALGLDRVSLVGHSMGGSIAFLFAERWPERVERLVIEDTPPPGGISVPEPPTEPPQPVPFDWRVTIAIVRQLNQPDPAWWDDLDRITAPTLIVGGGPTSHVPQDRLAAVARCIPNCRLVTIEDAGHDVHATRQDAFLDVVSRFLRDVDGD